MRRKLKKGGLVKMNLEKFKNIFHGKKKTENLVVLLVLVIAVIVAINYIWNGNEKIEEKDSDNKEKSETVQVSENIQEDNLENRMEKILSKIAGVGKVKVMITYSESSKILPIYDENSKISNTTESDNNGGTRTISEADNHKSIVYKENGDGTKEPVTQSIINPKIEGAIIAAEGADNVDVKTKIIQAVEAATGLSSHKIQVFEMSKGN